MENGETLALSVSDEASPNMEDGTFRSQQSTESFPSNNNVMGRHHHHHPRPLLSTKNGVSDDDDDDGGGPTQNDRGPNQAEGCSDSPGPRTSSNIFRDDIIDASSAVPIITSGGSGSAVVVRTLQPFDVSPTLTAFKSQGGGMAAASLGFPFTAAQWKELERQAMIYKYMMASVPVPPDLLLPTTSRNFSADPTAPLSDGSVYNLRCANRDLEPGRCKRTDGKKWRCSRDVAPHQKYCERHMHRGRPRSRKHVEVHPSVDTSNNKKTRLHHIPLQTNPTAIPNPGGQANNSNFSPLFLGTANTGQPKDPLFLGGAYCPNISSKSCYKEPNRVPDWMMDGGMAGTNGVEQQWLHLMDTKRGLAAKEDTIYGTNASILQRGYEEQPLNLFSCPYFVPEDMENRTEDCNMFPNSDLISLKQPQMEEYPMSRGFFDAWSNGNLKTINDSSAASSQENLSPSSLTLSIAMATEEGMRLSDVCHSVADSNHHEPKDCPVSWLPFPSGGPLAEVLQPSSVTGGSNPASCYTANGDSVSPSATAVSSPSGALHRALFSHSDSSVCNSPTIAASTAPPEVVAFQWLS